MGKAIIYLYFSQSFSAVIENVIVLRVLSYE